MRSRLVLALLAVVMLAAGCSAATEFADISSPAADVTVDVPQDESDATMTSAEIYDAVRDSTVYVQTPDEGANGSGIVIDDGWILTNAHLVERFDQMRIGRGDGTDLGLFDVHAVDWVLDLALIGPIEDELLVPIERGSSGELSIGSRVLLMGFPDENSVMPTPTLTEGVVSRRRSVAVGDFPFLQVDATIAPGQSGGPLVDEQGRLVGISGLEFGSGEFGLAFEADAMWPRIDDLLARTERLPVTEDAVDEFVVEIGPLRTFGFLVDVDDSGTLDISARSDVDVYVDVQTLGGTTVSLFEPSSDPFRELPSGGQLFQDEQLAGGEDVIATLDPGTYQIIVGSFADRPAEVTVKASNPMRPFVDIEEGVALPIGEVVEGEMDWSRDSDRWELALTQGQKVVITADGIGDIAMTVRLDGVAITASDDEGLGVYGDGAQVTVEADEDAVYTVEVGSFDPSRWGYLIEVVDSDS